MDRRHFVLTAASGAAALAGAGVVTASAAAATDDELTFANFGVATELLLRDFYGELVEAKLFGAELNTSFARGRFAAGEHAAALSTLLTDSGQARPVEEDFEFGWPDATFKTRKAAASTGAGIVQALLGAYLTGAATSPTPAFRVLYASLAASSGQQLGVFFRARGRPMVGNSFPAALDLEAASAAVEDFLG